MTGSRNELNAQRFDGPAPLWHQRTPSQRAVELASARSLIQKMSRQKTPRGTANAKSDTRVLGAYLKEVKDLLEKSRDKT